MLIITVLIFFTIGQLTYLVQMLFMVVAPEETESSSSSASASEEPIAEEKRLTNEPR